MTYKDFIQDIINKRGQWGIPEDEYFEAHHIIPICMGGEGKSKVGHKKSKHPNIIWLYAKEHFIAHKLLALENPNNIKIVYAWSKMAFSKNKNHQREEISPEDYETIKKMLSEASKGENNPMYGTIPWNKGKHFECSKETLQKLKELGLQRRGVKKSEETRQKMSEAVRKRYLERPETFIGGSKGKVSITNGVKVKYINKGDKIPNGYWMGGRKVEDTSKYKESWTKDRRAEWGKKYSGNNNPNYGNHKVAGGNNGHAIYIYTFEGVDYQCRDDLMVVLKERFPQITECTIRRIQRGQFQERTIKKFKYVIDNLTWRLKNNEDKVNRQKNT